jgi:hypothetical protein
MGASPPALPARHRWSRPFRVWPGAASARVSAKSRVGEKLACFARHWDGLILFLNGGWIAMDTNPVENAI